MILLEQAQALKNGDKVVTHHDDGEDWVYIVGEPYRYEDNPAIVKYLIDGPFDTTSHVLSTELHKYSVAKQD